MHTYGYYTGADGFYTGYYEPEVVGSRVKTEEFKVPLYGVPAKVAGKKSTVFSQYDRVDIEKGALAGKDLEICWVKNPVDAFFAQIQGSTRVKLDDGQLLRLNYIASNGKPYTPVGRLLIEQGVSRRRNVDGQDPGIHGSQPGRRQSAARQEPLLRFLLQDDARAARRMSRRARHTANARALDRGRSLHPRLRHADLDRRQISAQERSAGRHVPASDGGAGHRLRHPRARRAPISISATAPDIPSIAGRIKQFGKFVMLVPKDVTVKGDAEAAEASPEAVPTAEAAAESTSPPTPSLE